MSRMLGMTEWDVLLVVWAILLVFCGLLFLIFDSLVENADIFWILYIFYLPTILAKLFSSKKRKI